MKGPAADRDIETLGSRQLDYYSLEADHAYTLPDSSHERRLLVFRKTAEYARRTFLIHKDGSTDHGEAITSPENRRFKELRQLIQKPSIRKTGRTLVCGQKIILDNLAGIAGRNPLLVLPDGFRSAHPAMIECINDCARTNRLLLLKKSLYNELDVFATTGPLMAIDADEGIAWSPEHSPARMLAIPFQDPANVGAVIRSAVAFGIRDFLILKECAHPFHPKAVRASGGAVFNAGFTFRLTGRYP